MVAAYIDGVQLGSVLLLSANMPTPDPVYRHILADINIPSLGVEIDVGALIITLLVANHVSKVASKAPFVLPGCHLGWNVAHALQGHVVGPVRTGVPGHVFVHLQIRVLTRLHRGHCLLDLLSQSFFELGLQLCSLSVHCILDELLCGVVVLLL